MRRIHRRPVAVVLVALLAATACGSTRADVRVVGTAPVRVGVTASPRSTAGSNGDSRAATSAPLDPGTAKPGTPPSAPDVAPGSLEWQRCAARVECAVLTVPKDYADASKGTIDLLVKRRVAHQPEARLGSLLVNPGGPGLPGTLMVDDAPSYFSPGLLDRFDIVSWDPRGTGKSAPVVCRNNIDGLLSLDPNPDDPDEEQALVDGAKGFAADCEREVPDLLPYISTEATARDLEQIRKALGEEKLTYFGFSYGSTLGAYYATLFPASVRAMVLDGAIDPNATIEATTRAQAIGIERALTAALTACSKSATCKFNHNGDPFSAFDALMAKLDAQPLVVKGVSGAPPVGPGIAYLAVISTLYSRSFWTDLMNALAAADRGDGRQLLALYESYTTYGGRVAHFYDALLAIDCVDDPGPADVSALKALRADLIAVAPRLGGAAAFDLCFGWPVKAAKFTVTGKGAPPIVVVGTTGDPVTPIETSTAMAAALEHGVLLTVRGDTHTGYNDNDCATSTIDAYLVDLTVPAAGTVCA